MGKVLSLNAKLIENINLAEDILWKDYGCIEAGLGHQFLKSYHLKMIGKNL